MARRSPSRVRYDAPARPLARPVPTLPGPRGLAAIVRLERDRFWPGAARQALDAWEVFLRDPYHRLFDPAYGCGIPACCPDPEQLRTVLTAVVHALPDKDARRLRARLADLDELW
jgi:hypothetical protein